MRAKVTLTINVGIRKSTKQLCTPDMKENKAIVQEI